MLYISGVLDNEVMITEHEQTFITQEEAAIIPGHTPLMLLPLKLPVPPLASTLSPTLTSWSTLSIDLKALTSHFTSKELIISSDDKGSIMGHGVLALRFASVVYVKVYATCRLRRLWLSEDKEREGVRRPWELELYG